MIMVNLQIVFSVGIVLVSIGRRNLGGLSTDVEDVSRGCKAVDWIDCFQYSFLPKKHTFMHPKKMPAMQANELGFVFIRNDVLKEILTKHLSLG